MNFQTFSEHIIQLVGNGSLKQAIQEMKEVLDKSRYLDELIIQSSRFNDLKKQIRLGTIDWEKANATKIRISLAILELLQEIEDFSKEDPKVKKELKEYAVQIQDTGVTSVHGDVSQQGEFVAGRDLFVGQYPDHKKPK